MIGGPWFYVKPSADENDGVYEQDLTINIKQLELS